MVREVKKFTVTRIAPNRYLGIAEAAKGLGVARQSVYDYLKWGRSAIGPRKRARLVVVDWTAQPAAK